MLKPLKQEKWYITLNYNYTTSDYQLTNAAIVLSKLVYVADNCTLIVLYPFNQGKEPIT
jgi:hypothetical protein